MTSEPTRFGFEHDGKTVDCWVKSQGAPRWYFCVDSGSERPGPLAFEAHEPHEVQAIIEEIIRWCDEERGGVSEPPTTEEWADRWAEGTFDPPLPRGEMGNPGDAMEQRVERYYGILLSGFLSFVLSGIFTLIALGVSRVWLIAWGTGFVAGWPLAVGLVALFGKRIRRLAVALARRREAEE